MHRASKRVHRSSAARVVPHATPLRLVSARSATALLDDVVVVGVRAATLLVLPLASEGACAVLCVPLVSEDALRCVPSLSPLVRYRLSCALDGGALSLSVLDAALPEPLGVVPAAHRRALTRVLGVELLRAETLDACDAALVRHAFRGDTRFALRLPGAEPPLTPAQTARLLRLASAHGYAWPALRAHIEALGLRGAGAHIDALFERAEAGEHVAGVARVACTSAAPATPAERARAAASRITATAHRGPPFHRAADAALVDVVRSVLPDAVPIAGQPLIVHVDAAPEPLRAPLAALLRRVRAAVGARLLRVSLPLPTGRVPASGAPSPAAVARALGVDEARVCACVAYQALEGAFLRAFHSHGSAPRPPGYELPSVAEALLGWRSRDGTLVVYAADQLSYAELEALLDLACQRAPAPVPVLLLGAPLLCSASALDGGSAFTLAACAVAPDERVALLPPEAETDARVLLLAEAMQASTEHVGHGVQRLLGAMRAAGVGVRTVARGALAREANDDGGDDDDDDLLVLLADDAVRSEVGERRVALREGRCVAAPAGRVRLSAGVASAAGAHALVPRADAANAMRAARLGVTVWAGRVRVLAWSWAHVSWAVLASALAVCADLRRLEFALVVPQ